LVATTATVAEDANGNVTDDGTYLYAYDAFNRLIAVRLKSTGLLKLQHFYDAAGERAATISYNASGTATAFTQYLREGAQVVYEKTWGLPGWTAAGEKTYLYAQGKMAVTKDTAGGITSFWYYATDHLGTVRAAVSVDASGIEKSRSLHDYEPYGLEIVPLQTSGNTHRYTGHERDVLDTISNTTMDYMHFRSYASATTRFTRPDNLWGNAQNPQSWNLYAYVKGNPVSFNDPTGHEPYSYQQHWVPDRNADTGLASDERPDAGSDYYIHTSAVYLNGELRSATATICMATPGSAGASEEGDSGPIAPALARMLQLQVMKSKGEIVFDIFSSNGKQSAWWTFDLNKDGKRYMNAIRGEAYDLAIRVGVALSAQGADWIAMGHAHPEGRTNIPGGFWYLEKGMAKGATYREWQPGVSPEDRASYPGIAATLQKYSSVLPHPPALGVLDTNRNWIPYPFN
jgi:RHS repeat-associated protein